VLAKIPKGTQPGKLDLEIEINLFMAFFSDRQEERDSAIEWLVELADDPSQMQELTALAKAQALGVAGHTLFGFTNTKYCWTRSSKQIRRGARFYMRGSPFWLEHANSVSGWQKWLLWSIALDPAAMQTLCYTCLEEMHDYALDMLGEGGVELVNLHDS
jgi:hypothetical protein